MEKIKTKLRQIDKNFIKNKSASINMEDVQSVSNKEGKLKAKANNGILKRYLADIMILFSLLNDYVHRRYRNIPFKVVASIAFALIYILNPIDLIPDVIPILGQLDDLAVLTICLTLIESDLDEYKTWKEGV